MSFTRRISGAVKGCFGTETVHPNINRFPLSNHILDSRSHEHVSCARYWRTKPEMMMSMDCVLASNASTVSDSSRLLPEQPHTVYPSLPCRDRQCLLSQVKEWEKYSRLLVAFYYSPCGDVQVDTFHVELRNSFRSPQPALLCLRASRYLPSCSNSYPGENILNSTLKSSKYLRTLDKSGDPIPDLRSYQVVH